jgi:hypothetical protein
MGKLDKYVNKAKDIISDVGATARDLGSQVDDWGKPLALATFVSPLIAQDIAGSAFAGALSHGADVRTAFQSAATSIPELASGGSSQQWTDLAIFNAALATGAFAGGATSGLMYASPASASVMGTAGALGVVPGSVALGLGAGAAAYAGSQYVSSITGRDEGGDGNASSPPDVQQMTANDPDSGAQFQRLRKAARMLGRAGTIKYKGSGTSLGLGDQMLGDQLSLIGS